jgi:hypothetical protein
MSYPEDEKVAAPARDAALETSSTEKHVGGETDGSYGELESAGFDAARTKKLLRKTDKVLLPFLALLYLLSFLDRTNIGNARLANLEEDLHMEGLDYNIAVAVFFPFYVAAEIPSNMAMKRWRPSIWIPSIMVAWGIMTVMLGVVKNFGGLLAVRCLLGLAEGGLFPGVTYYITMWYKRHECGLRMAIFFSAATAAGAFGGLLAYGIMRMDGIAGLGGWAWIFILEGLATFIIGRFERLAPDFLKAHADHFPSRCCVLDHARLPRYRQVPRRGREEGNCPPPGGGPVCTIQRVRHEVHVGRLQGLEDLRPHVHHHWHLHPFVLHLRLPAHHCARPRIWPGDCPAHDSSTLYRGLFVHHWRWMGC